jgi:hypothetical protein
MLPAPIPAREEGLEGSIVFSFCHLKGKIIARTMTGKPARVTAAFRSQHITLIIVNHSCGAMYRITITSGRSTGDFFSFTLDWYFVQIKTKRLPTYQKTYNNE